MIVDAFTAVGGYQLRPFKIGIEQLQATLDKNGVDLAMTMSLRAVQYDSASGNRYIYDLAKKDPRILPVAVLDPRHYETGKVIDEAVKNEAVALAFHMTGIPYSLNSIMFRRAIKGAAASGKPLIFVSNTPGELTAIAELTRDFGCKKVLLAGCNYGRITEMLALLEEFEHIYVETSWQISPRSIELLAEAGRPDRVLFGSMAPLRQIRPCINMIVDADLNSGKKTDILARNALHFIGRDQDAVGATDEVPKLMGMPRVPAIDVHCHVGACGDDLPLPRLSIKQTDNLREHFNIEISIVSASAAYKDDMNQGNQQMLESVDCGKHMLGSVLVNPHHLADSIKWLDLAVEDRRIAHVTVHPATTYERYSSEGWIRLFSEIAARKLVLFYNTLGQDLFRRDPVATASGHLMRLRGAAPDEVNMLKRIDELFPQMPVIIGHGHGEEGLELARTCRNFYLELCSSYPEQNIYRRAVDLIGADRIVFGTDLEAFSPAFILGSMWEAELNKEEEYKILRENALRILKLDRNLDT